MGIEMNEQEGVEVGSGSGQSSGPSAGLSSASGTGPVGEGERIGSMDSARGFALLGILLVNMDFFSEPLWRAIELGPKQGATGLDWIAGFMVGSFCEGKFFTLFSLLFGMGLTIQFLRATQRGERFGARGVRRLLFLLGLGLMHALLLWYGDILFFYAICGLVLLACIKWKARSLGILAGVLLSISMVFSGGFGAFSAMGAKARAETAAKAVQDTSAMAALPESGAAEPISLKPWDDTTKAPFERLMAAWKENKHTDPAQSTLWRDMEIQAYREGPASSAFAFRAMTWAIFQIIATVAGFSIMILGMFALGASLLKAGLFEKRRETWWPRMAAFGLGLGLPLGAVAVWMTSHKTDPLLAGLGTTLNVIAGILVSIGTIGLVTLIVHKGLFKPLTNALANAGRMAMTNYLTQSLVATFIFYWWGLGKFGTFGDAHKAAFAVGLWTCQLVLSTLWLSKFRMGPMEWLWRCATYLKAQPFLR